MFLYTNNEILEKEHKNTVPFKIAPKRIKYLGINLTKEAKDLYTENYKTLIRELKKFQRSGKIFRALRLEELVSLKWPYYPKQSTNLMQFLSNYP